MYVCVYVYENECTHIHMHACIHVLLYARTCMICIHFCMCIWQVYVYMHTHRSNPDIWHIYIHTHKHISACDIAIVYIRAFIGFQTPNRTYVFGSNSFVYLIYNIRQWAQFQMNMTCMYVFVYLCMYVCIYDLYVCMHTYVCMYVWSVFM